MPIRSPKTVGNKDYQETIGCRFKDSKIIRRLLDAFSKIIKRLLEVDSRTVENEDYQETI